ncbi:MAG: hypothetical protein H0T51_27115 [Pirellulales bacterium]|nr:hypothetical protein [Pirellulales bacterium]
MNILRMFALLGLCWGLTLGCSAKTKEEAKEALEATGEAAKAAAEDTKANVKKAGEVLEAGVDSAKDKADELRDSPSTPSADDPADADVVPESQESQP